MASFFNLITLFLTIFIFITSKVSSLDLEERVQNLFIMSHKKGLIELDSTKFETYVRERPRNYSIIAMATAMSPKRGCSVCHEAMSEYKILYNSYRQNNRNDFNEKKIFFVIIDCDHASEVFTQLKINSAPGFYHFPDSNGKTTKDDKLDLNRHGFQAQQLAKFVNERTGVNISIVRPPSYATFLIIIGMAVLTFSLAYMSGFQIEWIYNKKIWAMISISIILLMTSGQMWNHIRGPPPMGRSGRGVAFIAGSSQQQYIFETYWVAIMYGMTSLAVILLGDHAADLTKDKETRRNLGMVGIVIFAVAYSMILATFRQKYQGYPYKLLF